MRALAVLIAIASACDLQPPPKKAPPVATPVVTPPVAAPNVPAVVPADAGVAVAVGDAPAAPKPPVDAMAVTDRCLTLGSHVAAVLLSEASDPSKKAALTQDHARTVRRTAESCTRDGWNEALISCYLGAKTQVALQACSKPEPKPAAGAPPVPSGSGPR